MRFILLTLFAFMIAAPASASSCYRAQEVEAENGIRIHSELMVIGLNCQHMTPAGYKNFYAQYREFSARHGDLFATYEDVLTPMGGDRLSRHTNITAALRCSISLPVRRIKRFPLQALTSL